MAKTAHGTTVVLGGVTLVGVTDVKLPNMSRGTVGTTNHATTTAKEFIPEDLYELGDCVITMDYVAGSATDDACLAAMVAAAGSPVAFSATVKAASGTEDIDLNVYGTDYDLQNLPAGDTTKQVAVLTLKPTGARTQGPS